MRTNTENEHYRAGGMGHHFPCPFGEPGCTDSSHQRIAEIQAADSAPAVYVREHGPQS